MTKNPKTLSPDTLVDEAIKLMNKQSITNYFITKKKTNRHNSFTRYSISKYAVFYYN